MPPNITTTTTRKPPKGSPNPLKHPGSKSFATTKEQVLTVPECFLGGSRSEFHTVVQTRNHAIVEGDLRDLLIANELNFPKIQLCAFDSIHKGCQKMRVSEAFGTLPCRKHEQLAPESSSRLETSQYPRQKGL